IHFIISAASTAMIVHVMLVDKKLDATLRAIDVLHDVRPYASVLMLVCVAVYFWDALGWRIPAFRRGAVKTARAPSRSLGEEPDDALVYASPCGIVKRPSPARAQSRAYK